MKNWIEFVHLIHIDESPTQLTAEIKMWSAKSNVTHFDQATTIFLQSVQFQFEIFNLCYMNLNTGSWYRVVTYGAKNCKMHIFQNIFRRNLRLTREGNRLVAIFSFSLLSSIHPHRNRDSNSRTFMCLCMYIRVLVSFTSKFIHF